MEVPPALVPLVNGVKRFCMFQKIVLNLADSTSKPILVFELLRSDRSLSRTLMGGAQGNSVMSVRLFSKAVPWRIQGERPLLSCRHYPCRQAYSMDF